MLLPIILSKMVLKKFMLLGYKAFRNYVVRFFEQSFNLKILGGYTGTGKTEILHSLKREGNK
jgi:tRNA 2-selenouridine synthase